MAIYFDNNATTALTLPVLQKQVMALKDTYGNPSDPYELGVIAKREIEKAREHIASLIGADLKFDQIIFTGCATEANNAVFHSAIQQFPQKKRIIVSSVEHPSVYEVAKKLETWGYIVTYIPVNQNGEIDLEYLRESVHKDTLIVSIMTANNETGVVYPIEKVVSIVRSISSDILIHTDAVQAIGKIPIDVKKSRVDFFSLSGHKFHAPKGIGALYVRHGVEYNPFLIGGHQERKLRAGTENTASIIAMGEAAIYAKSSAVNQSLVQQLRDGLESAIKEMPFDTYIIGEKATRLSNTSCIAFANETGSSLMLKLAAKSICVSTGSACNSDSEEPSHVIKAMSIPAKYQRPIRISLSNDTTQKEIDQFLFVLQTILNRKGR